MHAARREDRALIRIADMLVALAVLAERAGSMAFPVRFVVLAILRRAETVAHGFVVDATQTRWPYIEEDLETHNLPVDAAWVAWRLRLLAAALLAYLRLACGPASWNAETVRAPPCLAPSCIFVIFRGWRRWSCDTS